MSMTACRECGNPIARSATHCRRCGAEVLHAPDGNRARFIKIAAVMAVALAATIALALILRTSADPWHGLGTIPPSPDEIIPVSAPENLGEVRLDSTWIAGDYGYAAVRYRNDTDRTFVGKVEISCMALDPAGSVIARNSRSFFESELGSMEPGFTSSTDIAVLLNGRHMDSMRCAVATAF